MNYAYELIRYKVQSSWTHVTQGGKLDSLFNSHRMNMTSGSVTLYRSILRLHVYADRILFDAQGIEGWSIVTTY